MGDVCADWQVALARVQEEMLVASEEKRRASDARGQAVVEALAAGHSYGTIAGVLGVTRSTVQDIERRHKPT